ncbi:MAG: DUF4176 domain-containing protein [Bacilli bacterium]|nr:DUF4176 domain-containing protein [Bacilli bacterium]
MENKKYLPLGTVVLLKGGKKRLMITGFCIVTKNENAGMFDYCGCLYPEGNVSSENVALFNHDQIEKIYSLGYSDEEEKKFKEKLDKLTKKNQ